MPCFNCQRRYAEYLKAASIQSWHGRSRAHGTGYSEHHGSLRPECKRTYRTRSPDARLACHQIVVEPCLGDRYTLAVTRQLEHINLIYFVASSDLRLGGMLNANRFPAPAHFTR